MMVVKGHNSLSGSVKISGSKNESLAVIPISLCSDEEFLVENVPRVTDVNSILRLVSVCGRKVNREGDKLRITNSPKAVIDFTQSEDFGSIRASLFCIGPLLSRGGRVRIPTPGGCPIGDRPIDIHLRALHNLGASVSYLGQSILLDASDGLKGADIHLGFPSVGATLNVIAAATGCRGETIIRNIAVEPEIRKVVSMLSNAGANIELVGNREVHVEGDSGTGLNRSVVEVSPDRIEAGTFLAAGMACGGDFRINDFPMDSLSTPVKAANTAGTIIDFKDGVARLKCPRRTKAIDIIADVYPGFPTDLQPIFSAALCTCEGMSRVSDRVFKDRFQFTDGLRKLGAKISRGQLDGIVIEGRESLCGAAVKGTDIRGLAALLVGALSASGRTRIGGAQVLNRGYEMLPEKLGQLGCDIRGE